MKVDISRDIARQCAKPQCSRSHVQRHHKGSEAMWLRHFRHKKGRAKYDAFVERYHSFHPKDCVALCEWHHTEVHAIYKRQIAAFVAAGGYVPCRLWSWQKAEKLMESLRRICDEWLTRVTPGVEPISRSLIIHDELPSDGEICSVHGGQRTAKMLGPEGLCDAAYNVYPADRKPGHCRFP